MSRFLTNMQPFPALEELVELASKHSGIKVRYRMGGQTYDEMDAFDRAEAWDSGYTPDPEVAALFSESGYDVDHGPFFNELNRLKALIHDPLNEPILDDDYPVHQGRLYVVDGKVREFIDGERMTVGRWKALRLKGVPIVNEVRRCDITGRINRLPPNTKKSELMTPGGLGGTALAGPTLRHGKRRPRNSNKIKKVQG